jgi:hypothetical protein
VLLGLLIIVGCSAGSSGPSIAPSAVPSAAGSGAEAGVLPPGCEPVNLRGPSGERIVLDGTWRAEEHSSSLPETWWIRTLGDCMWAAGALGSSEDAGLFNSGDPGRVQTIRGTIGSDFVVSGEIVRVATPDFAVGEQRIYSPLRLQIEFDEDGTVVLREDRVYGESGPRCGDPTIFCIPVLVLRSVDKSAD